MIERGLALILLALLLATQIALVMMASTALGRLRAIEDRVDDVCRVVHDLDPSPEVVFDVTVDPCS